MKLKNLLDRNVRIVLENGKVMQLPKEKGNKTPKVKKKSVKLPQRLPLAKNWEVPLFFERHGKVADLPEAKKNVVLLVPYDVARASRRQDVVSLGEAIYKNRKLVGYNGFVSPVVASNLIEVDKAADVAER